MARVETKNTQEEQCCLHGRLLLSPWQGEVRNVKSRTWCLHGRMGGVAADDAGDGLR